MISLCAYGRNHIHFHSASGTLRQPSVTLTGRAAGCGAVILATGLQRERSGGRKRWIDEESVEWSGWSGSCFPPPESFLSPCPGLENQAHWSLKFLMLSAFYFSLTFIFFPHLSVTILQLLSPDFVILNDLKWRYFLPRRVYTHTYLNINTQSGNFHFYLFFNESH